MSVIRIYKLKQLCYKQTSLHIYFSDIVPIIKDSSEEHEQGRKEPRGLARGLPNHPDGRETKGYPDWQSDEFEDLKNEAIRLQYNTEGI